MMIRALCAALLATAIAAGTAPVKAVADTAAPAELPPPTFQDTQYVDSTGCAFVRAELNGATTWVPRMTRERSPVCGLRPSLAAAQPAQDAAATGVEAATASPPAAASAPRPARSATTRSRTKAVRKAAPPGPTYSAPAIRVRCPGDAPVLYRKEASGKVSLWCARQPQDARASTSGKLPPPPPGYRYAFEEGRFNPDRGERTERGTAEMNRIWTQDVPQRLVEPRPATPVSPRRYVQVGTYAVPGNARDVIARLQQADLPVGTASYTSGGRQLKVVLAGPFASDIQVQTALTTVRRAGFTDAFPRQTR